MEYPEIATNRNKVYNECSVLKSSRNHPFHPGPWKNCRPWNQPLVPKRLGTAVIASGSWYYFVVLGHQQKICWLNILIGKVGFLVYYVKYILLIKQNSHRMIEKGNEWCHSRNIYNRWNVISLSNVWYAEKPEGKMFFWKIRAENASCWKINSLYFLFMFLNSLHFSSMYFYEFALCSMFTRHKDALKQSEQGSE